ncbi:MAG: hypothetical protein FJW20_19650 [Acidimicrobiia bacterium]|nr:hypothetical protein [Acidimicrobiia bacterium]
MSEKEAAAAARRDFGGVEQRKETYRDRRGLPWVESLLADLAYGMRIMRRNAMFTVAVVLILTVGIGISTAVFAVAAGVLLAPPREFHSKT